MVNYFLILLLIAALFLSLRGNIGLITIKRRNGAVGVICRALLIVGIVFATLAMFAYGKL